MKRAVMVFDRMAEVSGVGGVVENHKGDAAGGGLVVRQFSRSFQIG